MHFAGILSRGKPERDEWRARLSTTAQFAPPSSTLELIDRGPLRLIADTRLTCLSKGTGSLLVNSGSLIPAPSVPVALLLSDDAELHRCLQHCRGNFAGIVATADGQRLTLFTDCLGTHPVYYANLPEVFAFSTSQRILTALLRGRLTTDVEGLLETCTFGFPLADRTTYRQIRCLDAAQIVTVEASSVRATSYWNWRSLSIPSASDLDELADRASAEFQDAIRRRQRPEAVSYTLLSGGMDSRSILATQVALGDRPRTLSISHPRALDAVLARDVAAALGADFSFHEIPYSAFKSVGGVAGVVHDTLMRASHEQNAPVQIWSGDGGSVGLGGVYLSEELINHARAGDDELVAETYLTENGLSGPSQWLFASNLDVRTFARRAVTKELARFTTARRTQIPYLFLMLNDQRRHLHYLFEIDMKVPLDFSTPFWDSQFMRVVLECPDESLLYHRFYSRFFHRLPHAAQQVPWQTYPGHTPCPLKLPEGYDYTWGDSKRPADLSVSRDRARRVLRATVTRSFPSKILRRSAVAVASSAVLLDRTAKRSYLVQQAETVLDCTAPTMDTRCDE